MPTIEQDLQIINQGVFNEQVREALADAIGQLSTRVDALKQASDQDQ
jgi:hypothetical protein